MKEDTAEKSCFDNYNFGFLNDTDSQKWKEKIEEIYRFLRGEKIKGCVHKFKPKLSRHSAIRIIHFLQNITRIIPDQFEFCDICKNNVFDSYKEGKWSNILGKGLCENHEWEYYIAFCEDCGEEIPLRQYSKRFNAYLCTDCRKKRLGKANNE